MVGFSPGGEKRYTAGIEWILQQFQVYNKDIDYPVYVSSHPPPPRVYPFTFWKSTSHCSVVPPMTIPLAGYDVTHFCTEHTFYAALAERPARSH